MAARFIDSAGAWHAAADPAAVILALPALRRPDTRAAPHTPSCRVVRAALAGVAPP